MPEKNSQYTHAWLMRMESWFEMAKWIKEKNKRLRESPDFMPHEIYKATRPKTKDHKNRGTMIHVAIEADPGAQPGQRSIKAGKTYVKPPDPPNATT